MTRQPLPVVLGFDFFCGCLLQCEAAVHVPHAYTENYATWLLGQLAAAGPAPLRVLDVCTGNGCIAIAAAAQCPSVIAAVGCDISRSAVRLAEANAARAGVATRATFLQTAGGLAGLPGPGFDIIVGNIPRMLPEQPESSGAEWVLGEDGYPHPTPPVVTFAGADGLALFRMVAAEGPQLLQCAPPPDNPCRPFLHTSYPSYPCGSPRL